jgi:hypothetical protein
VGIVAEELGGGVIAVLLALAGGLVRKPDGFWTARGTRTRCPQPGWPRNSRPAHRYLPHRHSPR